MFCVAATEEDLNQQAELVSFGEKNVGVTFIGTDAVAHLTTCKKQRRLTEGRSLEQQWKSLCTSEVKN